MATETDAQKRVARIRKLVDELDSRIDELTNEKARGRCIRIAQEVVGLLQAEDAHQQSRS